MSTPKTPIVLTILDGWGYRPQVENNAIALARKPTYDKLLAEFPNTLLHASDHFVGLPDGQMGNSEVGHLNIGAGRVVRMDISRIDGLIASGDFYSDPAIVSAMKKAAAGGHALHLLGLVSDGGVHAHQRHLYALLEAAKRLGLEKVYVHAFMDGRDTLPTSGAGYLAALEQKMRELQIGKIASISGRYYAMDRDFRWEREKLAFDAMVKGHAEGGAYADPVARVKELYNNGITDEFIIPFVVTDAHGHPNGPIRDEDVCIMFNYRADRARQITRVLTRNSGLTKKDGLDLAKAEELDTTIPRSEVPKDLTYLCMTQYDKNYTLPLIILPESMDNLLANLMSKAQMRNLRIAETEKYAHVTYFFNGGIETPFPGEDRLLIPSKKVATYDLLPEMSAAGIAEGVVKALQDRTFELLVVNFANADMVGHSGKLEPTIKGVETVDACLGEIYRALKQYGGSMLITADHGNAEMMVDPVTGGPHTAHTTNPVPFIYVAEDANQYTLSPNGSLRDISPTVLGMLNLNEPIEMTGSDLRQRIG
ncbi:2,3-bisphosphoglycerate-independent phosphoglycerate mutase [Silvibacterium dinghuense]|uniref:2,3-bisphosphoglycerate-independent phosphoglycerate mutase n=1 Tax=Silvibacterium dinghuense TaxID=1560006 RepID=A0A4Q1SFW0_9BACT|nr:2,3-bisphosphoglycerate-independent phosphoglycerate mutase [Silvibacterium dinghuense]RXS96461.1 2,3-bisphosphoglycerate-independent phosphoglycerate mutase [Silvibacterium dinghuense]GGG90951.1 2,3-bisphosphoglycerate-independent phosphoglycerate mutase [Silvibacterium dinghuense]